MYDGRIILLDADVIIHFIRGWQLEVLPTIYDSEYWIMGRVYREVHGVLGSGTKINSFVRDHDNVHKKDLPMEMEVVKEYSQLEMRFGNGESAVMAMANALDEVVASSNIRDVEQYCSENEIDWITTLDLLAESHSRGIFTAKNCNDFIQRVRENGSNLPDISIQEYIKQSG